MAEVFASVQSAAVCMGGLAIHLEVCCRWGIRMGSGSRSTGAIKQVNNYHWTSDWVCVLMAGRSCLPMPDWEADRREGTW